MGVGRRETEGKETSGRGSQDEPAQDKEENGKLNEQREEINVDVEESSEENIFFVKESRERAELPLPLILSLLSAAPSQPTIDSGVSPNVRPLKLGSKETASFERALVLLRD